MGFSLIEMLIAMAIMSMTLLISSLGYSFFMEKWQGNLGRFDNSVLLAKKLMLTRQALSGLLPYILRDQNNQTVIYFEGNQDSLVGVTARAFYSPKTPSVFRFNIVQADDFSYSLVYEEASLAQSPLVSLKQPINYRHKIVLFTNLSDIKFSYYGYKNDTDRINGVKQEWWQSFNALSRRLLPATIRISFILDDQQEQFEFPVAQIDPRLLVLFNDRF